MENQSDVCAYTIYVHSYAGKLSFADFCDFWRGLCAEDQGCLLEIFNDGRPNLSAILPREAGYQNLMALRMIEIAASAN